MTGVSYAATPASPAVPCKTGTAVNGTSKNQVLGGIGETSTDCSGSAGMKGIQVTIQILSYVVGLLGVIMVMVSAVKYVTSGGDSGKVASAKTTLIYALVGLAVAALGQLIVHFAINSVNNT